MIGAAVRQAREKRGLTQTQLSRATGIPQGQISDIEFGRDPRFSTFKRLVGALPELMSLLEPDRVVGDVAQ
jgi:transcriptional regulator with XRE-family HTH domain